MTQCLKIQEKEAKFSLFCWVLVEVCIYMSCFTLFTSIFVYVVIRGLDLAVATMKKGEHAEITIESEYGYGDEGMHGIIPGGATLIYDIELINWK